MKVIQISDCHLFTDINKIGYNHINPWQSLKRILTEVSSERPEVLLVTGDISGDGSLQSYQHFSRLLHEANLNCQIGIIPGNHDNQTYMQICICRDYLWLNKPQLQLPNQWHVHLLNTQHQATKGQISPESLTSLSKYVNTHSDDYHLVTAHHHPIFCGGWMDTHEWINRQAFNAVVAKYPAIKGVAYGHIHMAIEQHQNHCLYMACPATCWQFANQEYFAIEDLMPGFRVIKLLEDGQINTSTQRLTRHTSFCNT
ncbi:metallophosphoesterase [uncultured Paraglaciecola sp.]|uniref:metallophosphoesterase n=1 Tax=uncultured Paraglaciecola sp. TaxID=1765024 RepID=UPI0026115E61|nr:metallophosphoesterase [uncultured Paraglaciecola sp.]